MHHPDNQEFVIKVCGITTAEDAEDAIAAGATALGFNFYSKSPRYVATETARALARLVPPGILRVGVFVNASLEELEAAREAVPLDILQLHGAAPVPLPNARLWRSMAVIKDFSFSGLINSYEAYLLDAPTSDFGGSGQSFDWSLAAGVNGPARLIVAGGLDASNVAAAISAVHPFGVDACSRLESGAGRKDPAKVKAFVEAARTAFESRSSRAGPTSQVP